MDTKIYEAEKDYFNMLSEMSYKTDEDYEHFKKPEVQRLMNFSGKTLANEPENIMQQNKSPLDWNKIWDNAMIRWADGE